MLYTLLLHYPELSESEISPEQMEQAQAAFGAYARDLEQAGVLGAVPNMLKHSDATTTVSLATGSRVIHDGPFADTKEQIGGVFVIDVPGLDEAIDWATKSPTAAWGTVEVRPTAITFRDGQWTPTS
jgi:hypothetical protein